MLVLVLILKIKIRVYKRMEKEEENNKTSEINSIINSSRLFKGTRMKYKKKKSFIEN